MQIIPSIDIFEGRCVRLTKGDFGERTNYAVDPREAADVYVQKGARSLHVVDLEGAQKGRVTNWETLGLLLQLDGVEIQVGGGIRTEGDIDRLLKLGARRVVIGSVAVRSAQMVEAWGTRFGPERLCVAFDVRNGNLAHEGWQQSSTMSFSEAMDKMLKCGITRFLTTDISKDGTLGGPNLQLYATLVKTYPGVEWLASGGIRSVEDVMRLKSTGVYGVVVGKALFEGTVRLEDLLEAAC